MDVPCGIEGPNNYSRGELAALHLLLAERIVRHVPVTLLTGANVLQKSVIVDAQANSEGQRQLTAFMGGLDLCDGRWLPFNALGFMSNVLLAAHDSHG